ncbi:hypothetical protein SLOPH_1200 [Spraguea lophii 42_110]|uniref:Uncharacterized protein n=1 Tax=Spraguea lophii (strain 42_110) TaxID=1358809 RepID=S7XHP7_SPRLO|nr:hypothetical protein SLOPH_1200 [Spraguea lophii 42_110]
MDNTEYLQKVNNIFKSPIIEDINNLFYDNGYIRLNMIYINPIVIFHFKNFLLSTGLVDWEICNDGIYFIYKDFILTFKGIPEFYGDEKIFGIDIDFHPSLSSKVGEDILAEIETYLKGCDTLFFMTYFVDLEAEILKNPLVSGLEYLENRIVEKKEENDKW